MESAPNSSMTSSGLTTLKRDFDIFSICWLTRTSPANQLPVALGDFVRAIIFARLVAIGEGEDHALVDQLLERLLRRDDAEVVTAPCARTGRTADAAPRARRRRRRGRPASSTSRLSGSTRSLVVLRVDEAQVVPARARPLRHRVRLARAGMPLAGSIVFTQSGAFASGGSAVAGGFVILEVRRQQRQLVLGQRLDACRRSQMQHRERLAPVALAAEQPVAQLVLHLAVADAAFLPAS